MNFRNMSAWSIRNPVIPLVLFTALLLAGILSFARMDVVNNPDVEFPGVEINISQPGAAPSEIENQITQVVESAVRSINGVNSIQSTAREGSSSTFVEFEIGIDPNDAVSEVKNAVDTVRGSLPDGILEPRISKVEVAGGFLAIFAVQADDMTIEQLSWYIDDTVSKRLLAIEGMAEVGRFGGVDREIEVILDPAKMQSLGVTASQLNSVLRQSNIDAAGGVAEVGGTRQSVRVLGNNATAYELSQRSIQLGGGRTIKLADVAQVRDGFSERSSISRVGNKEVVNFYMSRAKGASDVTVFDASLKIIDEIQTTNPNVKFIQLTDSVRYTKDQYNSSIAAMIEGAILAVVVVFFFLRDWRATVISAVAIPLSAIPTFWFMDLLGFNLNFLSLLALGLVAGVLVDDAIVEIENIVRHMRMGKSAYQASIDAADEIGLAVVATSFCIVAVFLPVGLMPGISGQFFKNFGLTVVVAVLMSLAVARMITPMMAAYFLEAKGHAGHGDGKWMDRYMRILGWSLDRGKMYKMREGLPGVRNRLVYTIMGIVFLLALIIFPAAAAFAAFKVLDGFGIPSGVAGLVSSDPTGAVFGLIEKIVQVLQLILVMVISAAIMAIVFHVTTAIAMLVRSPKPWVQILKVILAAISICLAAIVSFFISISLIALLTFPEGLVSNLTSVSDIPILSLVLIILAFPLAIGASILAYKGLRILGERPQSIDWLKSRFMDHRVWMLGLGYFAFLLTVLLFANTPQQFQPTINTDESRIEIEMVPGTTIAMTERVARDVTDIVKQEPEVDLVLERVREGRATLYIGLDPEREKTSIEFERGLAERLSQVPDARVRFQSQSGGFGSGRDITIMLAGSDPVLLEQSATQLVEQMKGLDMLVAPRISADINRPEIIITPREDIAAELGVTTAALSQTIRIATLGEIEQNAAKFSLSDRQIPIRVKLSRDSRSELTTIANLPVPTLNGGSVPLGRVATIKFGSGPTTIQRYNQNRRVLIGADVADGFIKGEAQQEVNQLPILRNLPQGVIRDAVGEEQWQQELVQNFIIALVSGVLLVFAVLVLLYKRLMSPLVNMCSLALAPLGGIFLVWLVGQPVSMPVMIGTLMLLGIVSKNSILLIDFAIEEMATGTRKLHAIMEAGHKRAQPIVMTTVAMTAGMVPTALSLSGDGAWRAPMGTVVIGGLIMSTVLTLLIVPAGFSLADGLERRVGPWMRTRFLTYRLGDDSDDKAAQLNGPARPAATPATRLPPGGEPAE